MDPFVEKRSLIANVNLDMDTIDAVESQIMTSLSRSHPNMRDFKLTFHYGGKIIQNTMVLREYNLGRHSTLFTSFRPTKPVDQNPQ